MRAITSFLVGIIAALVALSLAVIVVQNSSSVDVIFLGRTYQAATGWLLLIFAGVGFVVAFLLLIPGRLASAWRSWGLSKQTHRLQDKLVDVQTQYALLEGELRLLRTERQQRIGAASEESAPPVASTGNGVAAWTTGASAQKEVVSPLPGSTAVAVAERPRAAKISAPPVSGIASATAGMRLRLAMMRGRFRARFARKRAASAPKDGSGS